MQVTAVVHTNMNLTRLALKPFDGSAVEQQQSYAPSSVGAIYSEQGLIRDDMTPPVGYNPFYAIA